MFDVIIIGGGPAGLCAAIYAGSRKLNTMVLEMGEPGGVLGRVSMVTHYPGIVKGETGRTIAARMMEQVEQAGVLVRREEVTGAELSGQVKKVFTAGESYEARAVILAGGTTPRRLGIPGEEELAGHGVSYDAVKDGEAFRGKEIYVAGGSDGAVKETLYLAGMARKATVIHFEDELGAIREFADKAEAADNIELCLHSRLVRIVGNLDNSAVASLVIADEHTGEERSVEAGGAGVFIYAGSTPNTELFPELPKEGGFLVTDEAMRTPLPGVFAVGDIRTKAVRQAATAVADGAVAAVGVKKYLTDGIW